MTSTDWALGVLAGGRSTRMGRDKASAPFRGGTLLDFVVARLRPAGGSVLASVGAPHAPVPAGARRVLDATPGLGPLAGIAALLDACPADWLLVVPVDLPLLPPATPAALAAASANSDAVVVSAGGRVEPFPVLIRRAVAPVVRALLDGGARRADAFHAHLQTRVLRFADAFPGAAEDVVFLNVNTPEDLRRAEALAASETG